MEIVTDTYYANKQLTSLSRDIRDKTHQFSSIRRFRNVSPQPRSDLHLHSIILTCMHTLQHTIIIRLRGPGGYNYYNNVIR